MLLEKERGVIEKSYYEASVTRLPPNPPLTGRVRADVCVVGAGYAGLSAALELAARGYSVAVLEAQRIGWGASGRNGGQVIVGFGSDGERAIERQFPLEDARRAWDVSVEGLQLLADRIRRYGIDCDYTPGYMTLAARARKVNELEKWMRGVTDRYAYPLEWVGEENIGEWIASERFLAGVYDARSGHLHPLKYCLGLAAAAQSLGVRIHENSAARVVHHGREASVKTAEGDIVCKFVVLAGNVYLGEYGDELAPRVSARIMPVGTYMIATEPMARQRAETLMPKRPAVCDNNLVLDYFRISADNRLLFGAGESYSGVTPRRLVRRMRERMLAVFPQLRDVGISHAWGGFVDISMNRAPDFGRIANNVYYLQGFSGHGLAMSGMAGKLVAEAIAGQAERFDLFARIRHRAFPGGKRLRTPALVLGMLYHRMKDALV
jgi:gamma-glutamylputrescine oxidase